MQHTISRRRSLKTIALGVAAALVGAPWRVKFVAEAQAQSAGETGVFILKLAAFPVLQNAGGSLLLQVPGMPPSFPQIVVTRKTATEVYAVDSICTHASCVVNAYFNHPTLGGIICNCHGSRYDADGRVLNGPATLPLTAYQTTFNGTDTVRIEIPGLGYRVTGVLTPVTGGNRYALSFPTVDGSQYEIRHRASLTGAESTASFATTPEGAATNTVVFGDNQEQTVYVDLPGGVGFFSVVCY
ncbi:MAG: ubiquinol-cytochrome c reductase iron-sulfur subunit [Verrucomicrobiota bacterium]